MTEIITCPKCGAFVGAIQPAGGVDLLHVGSLLVKHLSGFCAICGAEYYYNVDIRQLAKIIKKLDTIAKI